MDGITRIRQYKINSFRVVKHRIGERGGFSQYVVFGSSDSYIESTPPNGNSYIQRDAGMSVSFGIQKDGIWVVWRPGWGVDIHYPPSMAPEYMKNSPNDSCTYLDGPCCSDGSSLADGEKMWPAYRSAGLEGVFLELEKWFP